MLSSCRSGHCFLSATMQQLQISSDYYASNDAASASSFGQRIPSTSYTQTSSVGQSKFSLQHAYNFPQIFKDAASVNSPRLNCAEFFGPVTVNFVSDKKGWGLKAKKLIRTGSLILASKAFEVCYSSEVDPDPDSITESQLLRHCLVSRITRRLQENVDLINELYQLCPRPEVDEKVYGAHSIDANRIDSIVQFNGFSLPSNAPFGDIDATSYGHGIWILPSFLNHACAYNAYPIVYGDYMFLRAVTDIKPGDEILISYGCATDPLSSRMKFHSKYQFYCVCPLCVKDRSTMKASLGLISKRLLFFREFQELKPSFDRAIAATSSKPVLVSSRHLKVLKDGFLRFQSELQFSQQFDAEALKFFDACGCYFLNQGQFMDSATAYIAAYNVFMRSYDVEVDRKRTVPFLLSMETVHLTLDIVRSLCRAGRTQEARQWLEKSRELFKLLYGCDDVELLKLAFASYTHEIELLTTN